LILRKISKFDATRCQILRRKCTKFAPPQTPLGELTALPQTPAVFKRPTSKGTAGKEGGEGKGRGGEVTTGKGRVRLPKYFNLEPPLLQPIKS